LWCWLHQQRWHTRLVAFVGAIGFVMVRRPAKRDIDRRLMAGNAAFDIG
jgi:type IV secretory pathway TrbL component